MARKCFLAPFLPLLDKTRGHMATKILRQKDIFATLFSYFVEFFSATWQQRWYCDCVRTPPPPPPPGNTGLGKGWGGMGWGILISKPEFFLVEPSHPCDL